jgi:hypothetical protein
VDLLSDNERLASCPPRVSKLCHKNQAAKNGLNVPVHD